MRLIHSLFEMGEYPLSDRLEFYFPLYRYHSRWDELGEWDFLYELDGTKGGSQYGAFLKTSKNVSGTYREMDFLGKLSDKTIAYYEELFDYIEQEKIRVLFITNTSLTNDENLLAGINQVMAMAEERGFDTLNLKDQQSELGINTTTDYYNAGHTNIHGSIKYTDYLADYLVEHYGFADKRGQAGYESWDLAAEKYLDIISPYAVPEELDVGSYDNSLPVPELTSLKANGTSLTLKWKGSKGAAAYHVYRKQDASSPWELRAKVTSDTLSYTDTNLFGGQVPLEYTVRAYKEDEDGNRSWGSSPSEGLLWLPGIRDIGLSASPKDGKIMLAWTPVLGADRYYIHRRTSGGEWIQAAEPLSKDAEAFTNLTAESGVPYQYRVTAALTHKEKGIGTCLFSAWINWYVSKYPERMGRTVIEDHNTSSIRLHTAFWYECTRQRHQVLIRRK